MKFTRRNIAYLSIGVLILAILILNVTGVADKLITQLSDLNGQRRQDLNIELADTRLKIRELDLEALTIEKTTLGEERIEITHQRDIISAILAHPINKTDTIRTLFTTAEAYSLEILRMSLSGSSDAMLGEVPASSVLLMTTVEGDIDSIIGFVTKLNTLFTTGAVDSVKLSESENSSAKPTADIALSIYSTGTNR